MTTTYCDCCGKPIEKMALFVLSRPFNNAEIDVCRECAKPLLDAHLKLKEERAKHSDAPPRVDYALSDDS